MMDTGGAKGQTVPMSASEVIARAGEMLGIAPPMVINEYGMSELCSQLYDATSLTARACWIRRSGSRFATVAAGDGTGSGHVAAGGGRGNRAADVFRSRQRRLGVGGHDRDLGFVERAGSRAGSSGGRRVRGARWGSDNFRRPKRRGRRDECMYCDQRRARQRGKRRAELGADGRCARARIRALGRPRLRAPARRDRGDRGFGWIFGCDARGLDRRAAETVRWRQVDVDGGHGGPPHFRKTVGSIVAGNVAGAGIHEIAIALIAGARVTD